MNYVHRNSLLQLSEESDRGPPVCQRSCVVQICGLALDGLVAVKRNLCWPNSESSGQSPVLVISSPSLLEGSGKSSLETDTKKIVLATEHLCGAVVKFGHAPRQPGASQSVPGGRRGAEKRARDFVVLGPADRAALPRAAHLAKRAQLPLKDRFSKTSSGLILRNFSMFLMDVGIFASIELLRNSDQNS